MIEGAEHPGHPLYLRPWVYENENDADFDDLSWIIKDWQRNNKINKSNNVNTGKISLNQLKTSNSKLKSNIYYDSLHSNFE